jgi:hypothetical protein
VCPLLLLYFFASVVRETHKPTELTDCAFFGVATGAMSTGGFLMSRHVFLFLVIRYDIVKETDPYHVVIGAIQCASLWMWTDVPSYLPPTTTQPPLQLSLDYPMFENYGDGVMADYANANAVARRNGAEFEPLVNCIGLWCVCSHLLLDMDCAYFGVLCAKIMRIA